MTHQATVYDKTTVDTLETQRDKLETIRDVTKDMFWRLRPLLAENAYPNTAAQRKDLESERALCKAMIDIETALFSLNSVIMGAR